MSGERDPRGEVAAWEQFPINAEHTVRLIYYGQRPRVETYEFLLAYCELKVRHMRNAEVLEKAK